MHLVIVICFKANLFQLHIKFPINMDYVNFSSIISCLMDKTRSYAATL
ncbi:hypothetical protein LCGC14_1456460 [marine sediment metagenome]|uniref:Uncharacterized protein n=1 Tax=marine sediment metagenome TaxID=412755 RepID=A0A0F9LX07_9ZZZZ